MFRAAFVAAATAGLAACATAQPQAGFLTHYDGLTPVHDSPRAAVSERRDLPSLDKVRRIALMPTLLSPTPATAWMTDEQKMMLLREVDSQLCYALSDHFQIVDSAQADAVVRATVSMVRPTGMASSAAAAIVDRFIPGPLGVRPLGGWGALAAEAELVDTRTGTQLAAITWSRKATPIGTDTPSVSPIGDAMQFASPFAGEVTKTFSLKSSDSENWIQAHLYKTGPTPCDAYGSRFHADGMVSHMVTGLYVPQMNTARGISASQPPAAARTAADAAQTAAARAPVDVASQ